MPKRKHRHVPAGGKPGVDFIATNIAAAARCSASTTSCSATTRFTRSAPRSSPARVAHISEVLVDVTLPEMKHAVNATVTYHDACHLAHAQKVVTQPRALLAKVPGLKLVPLPESDMCCGAAGTYNLQHPQMATQLAERKLKNIAATGANICVTGNVGCAMQIQSEGDARSGGVKVVHPVEILHAAVFGQA